MKYSQSQITVYFKFIFSLASVLRAKLSSRLAHKATNVLWLLLPYDFIFTLISFVYCECLTLALCYCMILATLIQLT